MALSCRGTGCRSRDVCLNTTPPSDKGWAPQLVRFDLFATRIWQSRLVPLYDQLPNWGELITAMRVAQPQSGGRTNRRGWNSAEMFVLERTEFAALNAMIRAACTVALQDMKIGGTKFRLQSWINMHDRGGFNVSHVHEGSLLSGSFYVQVPQGSGSFVLREPRAGVVHGLLKGMVPNGHNDIQLVPEPGLLVIFPCWLEHYVEAHESDTPRITIAFNVSGS
jgi:uncharacterized protein (TIGR02466 family)